MHVTKSSWVGQTFALATSDDSRGRKLRIRRSKEERKEMVQSFIKKYQKSNNGNFPSLNLTHKEVGGSFYIVREIVREIIQENRVLAPAKTFPGEHNDSELLKQYPLGSISIEPQNDFSLSDKKTRTSIDITPNHRSIATREHISDSYSMLGTESFSSGNNVHGHNQAFQKGSEEPSVKHSAPTPEGTSMEEVSKASKQFSQPKSRELENEQIVNTSVVPENYQHDGPKFSQVREEVPEPATERLGDEHILYADKKIEKTNEFEEQISMESAVIDSRDRENNGAEELKASEVAVSPGRADVVVEKFPLRPLSSIQAADGESSKPNNGHGALGYRETLHDRTSESFSGSKNEKVEDRHTEAGDEKSLKTKGPSLESSNRYGTDKATALDVEGIRDVEVKQSSPGGTAVSSRRQLLSSLIGSQKLAGDSPEELISTESTASRENPNIQDDNIRKENNPLLDRISRETQAGTSKETPAAETNALWALLIAFLLALVKFWTK